MTADANNEYPKASNATLIGATITYVAGLFLLLSFAGPYWIQSYPEMFSSFKHMGLWEYCFDRFRFPAYQYDKYFDGCHYIFGTELYKIREWLLPGWLMTVQSFVTLGLMFSFTAQVLLACVIIRMPLRTVLRYEWIFVSTSFILVASSNKMKKRSLAGNCGIIVFLIALVTVALAFGTPSWLVSDYRIRGAKLDRLGLWSHCFRSLADPLDQYQRRSFFVGCRWVYDPFTTGYDKIRGYLLPGFMIATQLFFTLCLIGVLISTVLVIVFFLCCGPNQNRFVLIIRTIGFIMLAAGISGGLAVIVFACFGNTDGWMPDHANNYLGWSFGVGVVGAVACVVAAALFLTEANIQLKKRKRLKESQARFELVNES